LERRFGGGRKKGEIGAAGGIGVDEKGLAGGSAPPANRRKKSRGARALGGGEGECGFFGVGVPRRGRGQLVPCVARDPNGGTPTTATREGSIIGAFPPRACGPRCRLSGTSR